MDAKNISIIRFVFHHTRTNWQTHSYNRLFNSAPLLTNGNDDEIDAQQICYQHLMQQASKRAIRKNNKV